MQRTVYGSPKQVLGIVGPKVALSVQLNDTGIKADAQGKKIIPAGTPIGGATSALNDETAVLSAVSDSTAQGVLEYAVDVSAGHGNGAMIVFGYVNEYRLPDGVKISDNVKTALANKVTFFKRNK
jgi:hypothetical protein